MPDEGIEWYEIEFISKNFESGKFKFVIQPNHLDNNVLAVGHSEQSQFQIYASIITTAKVVVDGLTERPFRANIVLGKLEPIMSSYYEIPKDINTKMRMIFEIEFENWIIKSCKLDGSNLIYLPDES